MTHHIKSIIAHKFRSSWKFWNSALVPPSPPPPLDNSGFTPPYFPLFSPTTYILPLPINPPPKKILQDKNFLIHAFPPQWHTSQTTLHKALTDWLLESRVHTLFIQQLPVDDIWPKKIKKLWSVMHILLRITLGKMFTKCLEKVCLVKKAHWHDHYTT